MARASTHRLKSEVQVGLDNLSKALRRPKNKLINEAVHVYVQQKSREVEQEMEASLRALRSYRKRDPDFEKVIDDFVVKFQKRDRAGMVQDIDPNFTWIDQSGEIVAQGADSFFSIIDGLWAEHPDVQNSSSICLQVGNLVTHTESFKGYTDGHTEDWVWVYEFKGVKILKMYGFKVL